MMRFRNDFELILNRNLLAVTGPNDSLWGALVREVSTIVFFTVHDHLRLRTIATPVPRRAVICVDGNFLVR